jgi:hypothetical protein
MADVQAEIPEHVQQILDDLLDPRGLLVGQQKQQVDVGARRQLAATVATDGHDGDLLGLAGIGVAVNVADGEVVEHADQLIDQVASRRQHLRPAAARLEAPTHFGLPRRQRGLEALQHGAALLLGGRAVAGDRR